jgi:3-oxoadipyl-CoA thiolase
MIVATEEAAKRNGLTPRARILGAAVAGVPPRIMGIGPVPAVRKLLAKTGLAKEAIDEVELNEAFAAQVLACNQELAFDLARLNPDGGAIALGHPIGATGARILVTLLHGMEKRGGTRGIATLCVSGGMGIAALVERESAA